MEKWKPIKGQEGKYEISNKGRVRSLRRRSKPYKNKYGIITTHIVKPRILSIWREQRKGYSMVTLNDAKKLLVHRDKMLPKLHLAMNI